MKLNKCVLLGITTLSFGTGLAVTQTNAEAYTSYKSIPHAIRGYYISRPGNQALILTRHHVRNSIPQSDSYVSNVTSVNYSNHNYHIHSYENLGKIYRGTDKLHFYAKGKFTFDGYAYHKVKASTCGYFLNHYNPDNISGY